MIDEVQKAPELGGVRQASVGRGHPERAAPQGRAHWLGAAPDRTRAHRESRGAFRASPPAPLELFGDERPPSAGPWSSSSSTVPIPGRRRWWDQPDRWSRYVSDSLVETTISRDVLLLSRVDKPALLRRLFELGCAYSGQILSYTKMLAQLQDAGNTTTLAHYLQLLSGAGMLTGLQKYSGAVVRRRSSSPKLQVLNTALMTAGTDLTLEQARADREFRGRLVESAVGAHLANAAGGGSCELFYWRDRNRDVDFVVRAGRSLDGDRGQERTGSRVPAGDGGLRRGLRAGPQAARRR